jgi:hypothetical protein
MMTTHTHITTSLGRISAALIDNIRRPPLPSSPVSIPRPC